MKHALIAALFLTACAPATQDRQDCTDGTWWRENCTRDRAERIERPEPPTRPRDVCDGGARACGDGEKPTGTVDDPRGYL